MEHRLDYHRMFAAKAFGVPYEEVTRFQRGVVKLYSFGALYGAGEFIGKTHNAKATPRKGGK